MISVDIWAEPLPLYERHGMQRSWRWLCVLEPGFTLIRVFGLTFLFTHAD